MTTATTTTAKTRKPAARKPAAVEPSIATNEQLDAWADSVETASVQEQGAAKAVLDAVLAGRELKGVSADKYRDLLKLAFAHLPKRVIASRVSEAMAILKAPSLPKPMPENLQHAAKAVRALPDYQKAYAKPSGKAAGKVASSAVKKIDTAPSSKPSDDVRPLSCEEVKAALRGTLEGMRKRAGDKEALELIAALADILE